LGSSVKDEWQHALETIDPMASDGEVRLKQLLVQVEAYRNASGPFRATSSAFDDAASARQRIAQRQRLTASLELLEVHLKSLIRYAGWWRTA
jgi:hypothetical protein